jgi:hypothetical protein
MQRLALTLGCLLLGGCSETTRQFHVVEINHHAPQHVHYVQPSVETRVVMRERTRNVVPDRTYACSAVAHPDSDGLRIENRVRADLARIGIDEVQIEAEVRKLRQKICD